MILSEVVYAPRQVLNRTGSARTAIEASNGQILKKFDPILLFAPFAMVWLTSGPSGINWHNWLVVASACEIGKKPMVKAAQVMAASAVELILNPQIIAEAKEELATRLSGRKYRPIIPAETEPPTDINRKTMEKYRPLMERYYEKCDQCRRPSSTA